VVIGHHEPHGRHWHRSVARVLIAQLQTPGCGRPDPRQLMSTRPADDNIVTAGRVMSSPVITVGAGQSLWDAWTVMSSCSVRHVVVTVRDRCVGVIDDRGLVAAWPQGPGYMQHTSVRSTLDQRTACVLPDAPVSGVAEIMNTNQVDAVPVVDETGKLLGLVTAVDVIRAVARCGIDGHQGGGASPPLEGGMNEGQAMTRSLPITDIAARDAGSASAWPLLRPAVLPSQLACCCPAQPLDQVIFPTTTSHDQPVEVLLCGHHYRLSRATLLRVGSPIYDVTGQLIAHRV
jgi:CBS domain-containing protein